MEHLIDIMDFLVFKLEFLFRTFTKLGTFFPKLLFFQQTKFYPSTRKIIERMFLLNKKLKINSISILIVILFFSGCHLFSTGKTLSCLDSISNLFISIDGFKVLGRKFDDDVLLIELHINKRGFVEFSKVTSSNKSKINIDTGKRFVDALKQEKIIICPENSNKKILPIAIIKNTRNLEEYNKVKFEKYEIADKMIKDSYNDGFSIWSKEIIHQTTAH